MIPLLITIAPYAVIGLLLICGGCAAFFRMVGIGRNGLKDGREDGAW